MNILSYVHIHRLPNPSGVGRVIDRMLTRYADFFPEDKLKMLVERKLYDQVYLKLANRWKCASFIPHALATTPQQARWVMRNRPLAEAYWDDVDMVYCPAESYVPTLRGKLVCTIHDVAGFEETLYPNTRERNWHCMKWRYLFRSMAENADAVVTVSDFSASRIAHYFPALESKLHVIYNAPHAEFGTDVAPDVLNEVDELAGGMPYILVPGGLSLRKNAEVIIKALPQLTEKLPDVKLIIAGSNSKPYVDQARADRSGRVVLAGYVSDELLNALYQRAAAVWFPSRYEGFGMPVIEAMAAGAPVVASRAASIPEVVDDAALLCDVDDPTEHVDALHSVLNLDSSRRKRICRKSRQQAGKFTWKKSVYDLNKLFYSLHGS